ncbi:Coenzyme F420 hydrogenase/dehydrogenase, beta subunit C-terminal domain [Sphingobium sp. CAP-1]|uniref:Coenzyme F420 hydrogenase/dehydrogenase, beta subunit C-terminal domain n=1 Tax=Sphingobium sp. CAP-1 TaxID=2676077 RepID=UPI0012BB30E5|nr:Coenzyme F420 hydrogenase/dehydrogenase, beta subunit C-terminal domain [Sphingobium sp. CAP-1]QGP78205.1 hypothetical protein GL174_03755 [Sphingobium sp. CAP-1]
MTNIPSPTLQRVLQGELCSGCGLCAGVASGAITMGTVAPGYSRPIQSAPLTDQQEQTIAESCPGAKIAPWGGAPHQDMFWGPWRQVLTGHALDPQVRFAGSSGGAISALLIHALESGLVDDVLHIAPSAELPTRNRLQWSRTRDEVMRHAGSRYAASSPLADIGEALDSDRRTAFVGKPCDVSALRQLALIDPRVDRRFPIKLSFFCGGLPSHDGADRIVRALGLEPRELTSFRYRGQGWPGMARAETADGRAAEMSYADSWGGHLSKEVQFRCKICPDAVGGVADIACADAWYGDEDGYPSFDEQEGRSLIISRTPAGDALLAAATTAGALTSTPLDIREIDLMQPAQARRKRLVVARTASCRILGHPVPQMHNLNVIEAARTAKMSEQLRNFLGMLRRIIQKRK